MPDLRDHTTLRLGGPGRDWVRATTEAELVSAVADADAAGTPVLVLAGGSNLVVADSGAAVVAAPLGAHLRGVEAVLLRYYEARCFQDVA